MQRGHICSNQHSARRNHSQHSVEPVGLWHQPIIGTISTTLAQCPCRVLRLCFHGNCWPLQWLLELAGDERVLRLRLLAIC